MENAFDPIEKAPTHHPPSELLIDYAAGSASEAEALMIAIHLDACLSCRRAADAALAIGGALLDDIAPAFLPPSLFQRTLRAIDAAAEPSAPQLKQPVPAFTANWPAPLRAHLAEKPTGSWRRLPAGFRALRIPVKDESARLWIMKAPGGRGPLLHSHAADEWTVVLEGGFTDETGTYAAGDFACMAPGDSHRMVAEPGEGCVCLLLTREHPRYLTWLGKLLAPLLRL
jgi:putative transcriptional regulator